MSYPKEIMIQPSVANISGWNVVSCDGSPDLDLKDAVKYISADVVDEKINHLLVKIHDLSEVAEECLDYAPGGCARDEIRYAIEATGEQLVNDHKADAILSFSQRLIDELKSKPDSSIDTDQVISLIEKLVNDNQKI